MGPSVKTITSTGEEIWGIVKSDATSLRIAGKVQSCLNRRYKISIRATPAYPQKTALGTKAQDVQKNQRAYFEDFVNLINGKWDDVDSKTQKAVTSSLSPKELETLKKGSIGTGSRTV